MSDVWEFKNGVMRIVEMENLGGRQPQQLLVYLVRVVVLVRSDDVGCVGVQERDDTDRGDGEPRWSSAELLLVYLQTEELITSHQMLEDRLRDDGWVHYPKMPSELIEYHKGPDDNYLISLSKDFSSFSLIISI
ncbi:hypothetical protein ZIOFF_035090 [Zingiber officinale]|uniref:Uncharacterized protein n=1 Tax=Zingiber officinale TaxID=94328 RepID=A0A8J5GM33_ZINOF|nr:hypothetical protein ZIOFF_035090 [Zingiber officinale]